MSQGTTKGKKKKKKTKAKLSPEQKEKLRIKRRFYSELRGLFRQLGFHQAKCDGVEIKVGGRTGEIDECFIYENVIVLVEHTAGQGGSAHVLKKKPFFDNIQADVPGFLSIAKASYPDFQSHLNPNYHDSHYRLKIVYASLYEVGQETIDACPNVIFLPSQVQKYFYALGKTIQSSGKIEFFTFLGLSSTDVGSAVLSAASPILNYEGQLLPESMSSYPKDFKVVSFYADPESLIAGAYVLRRDGWRDETHLYQRILVRSKIAKMRKYLVDERRVFVNNVIVTLPHDTTLLEHKKEADKAKAKSVTISIPVRFNAIGIIDGQHRVFCYHEGSDASDGNIAVLRKRQHLLVTGIIYPPVMSESAKLALEARLFLEINDTQTRTRPALRQDIETIVRPFSGIAVARRVIAEIARKGPYKGLFQLSHFDSPAKIKTSSIVSYGLRPLVKFDGTDSLFAAWSNINKNNLKTADKKSEKDSDYQEHLDLLTLYVDYCVKSLNDFLTAAKLSYGTEHWNVHDKQPSILLRPTSINGLIACLRRIIEENLPLSPDEHAKRFKNLTTTVFASYKSSRWNALGQSLFDNHYK